MAEDDNKSLVPEVGQVFEKVKIISVGSKGDGIFKTENGFIIIVQGAAKGDIVDIKVKKVFEKYAFAEVVKKEGNAE